MYRHDNFSDEGRSQHTITRLTPVLRLVIIRARHEAQHILRLGSHGGVRVVDPLPVLIPDDGGKRVATVGLADQTDRLPHSDGLALDVTDYFWSLWGI